MVNRFSPEFMDIEAGRRITIPRQYCEKIPGAFGKDTIPMWLLMLVPGRFRLLSDSAVEQDPRLREVRSSIVDGPVETDVPATAFEPNERAAIIGRLIPTTLAPGKSCRLTLPKQIVPDIKDRQTFVVMFALGYLEIWLLDTYNAALAPPLDSVI